MVKQLSKVQEFGLKIEELNNDVKAIHDEVDEKQDGIATAEQITKVKDLNKQIEELELKITQTSEWQESQKKAAERKQRGFAIPGADEPALRDAAKSLSELVFGDDTFVKWLDGMRSGSGLKANQFGTSPGVDFKVYPDEASAKSLATGTSSTSAGAFIVTERKPIVDPGTSYVPLTIFDFLTVSGTGSDTIDYVREGTHTNNASVVAEATGTGNGTGAAPESDMVLSVRTINVKDIAHFMAITRNAMADAPQMRTLIDAFLMYGLRKKLQREIIQGPDLTDGIVNLSGTTAQAWSNDIFETTRKARTKVRTTGRGTPTATGMHPNDWETIDLMKDGEDRYYYGGPSVIGMPRLWGLPVFECEDFTEGQSITAEWRLAMLWLREDASLSFSDSHADFFVRRLVAMMAALRGAFDLIRPAAFVITDLTA